MVFVAYSLEVIRRGLFEVGWSLELIDVRQDFEQMSIGQVIKHSAIAIV